MLPGPKVLAVASVVSFCSNWQFGYQITYINTAHWSFSALADQIALKSTKAHLALADWNLLWSAIVASFYAGTLIGFVAVPRLIRAVGGVRNALLCSSAPALLGCMLQLGVRLANSTMIFGLVLSLGRLLVGIQAGCSLCLLPLFIIETSAFAHRPFLSSLQMVFQSLATLLGLVVGSDSLVSMGPYKLEWLQVIGLIPSLFFASFLCWLPETPFRLLEKCHQQLDMEADEDEQDLELAFEHSALFYYGPGADFGAIRAEAFGRWRAVPAAALGVGKGRAKALLAENWKGLLVGTLASVSFAFTADDLIDSYSAAFLYRSSNSSESSADLLTAGLGLLLFITSIFGAFLADRFGRRRLLIGGLLGTALSNAGAAFGASRSSETAVSSGFALTKLCIGVGAGAPAWFLTSELVSPRFVAQAQAASTGFLLFATGFCSLSFLPLQHWFGSAPALLCLSSGPALVLAILLFALLPETRGLPFDQIHHLLTRHALPGLVSHPRVCRILFRPLLAEKAADGAGGGWERNWELPHRAQRLMAASSYVSYGSLRSVPSSPLVRPSAAALHPPPLFRRHSEQPPVSGPAPGHHRRLPSAREFSAASSPPSSSQQIS